MKRRVIYLVAITLLFLSTFVGVSDSRESIYLQGTNIQADKELLPYIKRYLKLLEDHNIEYDKSQPFLVKFNRWANGQTLGVAWGMFEDGYVNIHINKQTWAIMTANERLITMFHELSHDLFNLEHGSIELMKPYKPSEVTSEDLKRMTKELVKHLSEVA